MQNVEEQNVLVLLPLLRGAVERLYNRVFYRIRIPTLLPVEVPQRLQIRPEELIEVLVPTCVEEVGHRHY